MCFAFSPLPLKSSLCQIIVIFNIFLLIYYNEINLIIGIVEWCVYRSTDKKSLQMPKGLSEVIYRRRAVNAMAKRKRTK
jgi:hypothetical protein